MNTILFLQLAGLLQISLLVPGLVMPHVVRMRENLATLPVFLRRLFWVYYVFTGIHFLGCGILTFAYAGELAAGASLARGFCAFLAVYWAARFAVTLFVFDVRPFLTTALHRVGHHTLNTVFVYLTTVFAWSALPATP